ncbi:MAG: ankyrin repeat domain-containing protein [Cycloclasticus sp.]
MMIKEKYDFNYFKGSTIGELKIIIKGKEKTKDSIFNFINMQNNNSETLLMHAIMDNDLEKVRFLIENGADINILDKNGSSAFDYAIEINNEEIMKILDKHKNQF